MSATNEQTHGYLLWWPYAVAIRRKEPIGQGSKAATKFIVIAISVEFLVLITALWNSGYANATIYLHVP